MNWSKLFYHSPSLMIINDFYFVCIALFPHETDAPLVIDTNTVLACSITCKFLQAICRRHFQILQTDRAIQHAKLTQSHLLNVAWKLSRRLASKYFLSFFVTKTPDHTKMI